MLKMKNMKEPPPSDRAAVAVAAASTVITGCSSGEPKETGRDCKLNWCSHCGKQCAVAIDPDSKSRSCGICGRIISQDDNSSMRIQGIEEIQKLAEALCIGGDVNYDLAHELYEVAVDKNFTQIYGYTTSHVAAACLYFACRQAKKEILLIDFSDYLRSSVYILGDVFLLLLELQTSIVNNLNTTCLFIHKFTESLLNGHNAVCETALRIIASMKKEWMQAGRQPASLCAAALHMAAHSHGFSHLKPDTIEELLLKKDETHLHYIETHLSKPGEMLCKHRQKVGQQFGCVLCKRCYNRFIRICGALDAFPNGERHPVSRKRIMKSSVASKVEHKENVSRSTSQFNSDRSNEWGNATFNQNGKGANSEETFSDVDDEQIDKYLLTEDEKKLKKILWESTFRDYDEDRAAKLAKKKEFAESTVGKSKKHSAESSIKNSEQEEESNPNLSEKDLQYDWQQDADDSHGDDGDDWMADYWL